MKIKSNGLVISLLAGLAGFPALVSATTLPATGSINDKTITATGKAAVNLPQTQGVVVLGVSSTDSDPKDAQESVRRKADKLVSAIRQLQPLSIATTVIAVNPVWSYKDNTSKITGYTANYSLTVTSNINQVGSVIDKAIDSGADNIGSPVFSASDKARESASLAAIKLATQDAKAKAEAALSALNIKSGTVKQIFIQNSAHSPYPVAKFAAMSTSANDKAPATEVAAGNDVVNAEVSIIMSY